MTTYEITPGAVVAAVDGSASALQAAQWAAAQAELEGRPLALVHVTENEGIRPTTLRLVQHEDERAWLDDTLRASHLVLRAAADAVQGVAPGVRVHGLSLPGEPRRVLPELSEQTHLMVLGSRGRGPLRSKLLGSVSAHLARATRSPLVVVRPGPVGTLKDGVVVAADATAESRPVLEFAYLQASLHAVPLTIVHCLDDVATLVSGRPADQAPATTDVGRRTRALAESLAGLAEKYPDVHATEQLVRGPLRDRLVAHPRLWNLIVMGRHPVHGLDRLLGSNAVDVLEHAASPIAVVPQAAPTG